MLSRVADYASVISVFVTLVIAFITYKTQQKVSDLQKKHLLKVRTPIHRQKLENLIKEINSLANDWITNRRAIQSKLALVKSEISNATLKLPKLYQVISKEFLANLNSFDSLLCSSKPEDVEKTEDALWKCINCLNGIINTLENILEDAKKEI